MIIKAYILDAPYHIDRPFDYFSDSPIAPGTLVRVPFGKANGLRIAVTVGEGEGDSGVDGLKPVHSVLQDRYSLSEEMLGLCSFLKEHTLCTYGEAVRTVLPPGAISETLNLKERKVACLAITPDEAGKLLSATGRAGIRSEGQREVLNFLIKTGEADTELLTKLHGVNSSHIRALADKGYISVESFEQIRNPYASYAQNRDTSPIILSNEQQIAYDGAEKLYFEDGARAALLYGVTGSGKTKVILRLIDRVIEDGRSAIMLVPEISLTPQTVNIFCRRYGERVAVIHSSLSKGERLDAWRRIDRGEVDLVIGTRSAIFAPLKNLGLIVIDEEHEHTYKSESDPKYHARDVAAYRCGRSGALMLLASATPSLESFYKAQSGVYTLLTLRQRYGGRELPEAIVVDMREELRRGNLSAISDRLHNELSEVYEEENQAIIFLNRRGYSAEVSCKSCGEVIRCPRCSVSLTHHTDRYGGKLLCHLCGYSERLVKKCPSCGDEKLSYLGFGTQKLEGELEKYLPDMKVMRMDADTTGTKQSYDKMLESFRNGESDILLGTQMVAKGHDFPKVTLVGVALADTSLYHSDFRASERTFSLLTQVIGRAGRAQSGVAVIQTYSPYNEVLRLACMQNYDKFYEGEIALRRELKYPPFCDMVNLTLTADDEQILHRESDHLASLVREKLSGEFSSIPFMAFGPFEAQVYKLCEKYRMRMVIKCRLNRDSRRLFHELLCEFSSVRDVTLSVDLNPLTV